MIQENFPELQDVTFQIERAPWMSSTKVEGRPIPGYMIVQYQVLGSDASRGVFHESLHLSSHPAVYPVLYTFCSSAVTSLGVRKGR